LQAAQVIDSADRWTGGKTELVVSAARVDGALSEMLTRLQAKAETAGGRVHVLVGPTDVLKVDDSLFVWDAWYRSEAELADVLREYGVQRVVLAHGDGMKGIIPRYHGKVILNDDPEHLGCLVIEYNRPFALYRGHGLALPADEGADLERYRRQISELSRR
jgi:hypothetical protein